jgi:hypothetical protein
MYQLHKETRHASSRRQIDILGARNGVLLLTRQRFRSVMEVSSVNFELKSEAEQDVLIETYQSFLNAISCPLQFLIRTRELDMDKYLRDLGERLSSEREAIYRSQLKNYALFIHSLIETNKILTRNFYVVIPYDGAPATDFSVATEHIAITADIVRRGFRRLGMQCRDLSSVDVLDLFYSFYNPRLAKIQPLSSQAISLLHASFIRSESAS